MGKGVEALGGGCRNARDRRQQERACSLQALANHSITGSRHEGGADLTFRSSDFSSLVTALSLKTHTVAEGLCAVPAAGACPK